MALRSFLRLISTNGQSTKGEGDKRLPTKLDKDMRKSGVREVEGVQLNNCKEECSGGFRMPLHYPRYNKEDYERMEECKVDMLLKEYGLACEGPLEEKRAYAIGAFVWPDQI